MKQTTTTKLIVTALTLCSLLLSNQLTNAQCHIDDWTALKALYEATDVNKWRNNDGWEIVNNEEPPMDCDLEDLYGVTVNADGRVDLLNLSWNNLIGTIPPQLGKLIYLRELNFYGSRLWGIIPPELGNLNKLTKLQLKGNLLVDKIPPELGNLVNLEILDLSGNNLREKIPSEIGNLNKLKNLDLENNSLGGNIPSELGNLTNLTDLNLVNNQLRGNIPSALGSLSNLSSLNLSNNQLNGSIPLEFSNLINLSILNLSINELSGSVPLELRNLINLTSLILFDNQLSGNIPSELSNLSISKLDLSDNQLSGNIPPELGDLISLVNLNISRNKLSGNIPPELGNLSNLVELILSGNQLNGNIPPELGNLSNLVELILSGNQLNGSIPPELGNLSIQELSLSNNQLNGNIPFELGNIADLVLLKLDNNALTGNIPKEFAGLNKLHALILNNNQLTGTIPTEFENFENVNSLEYLIVSNNFLSGRLPRLWGSDCCSILHCYISFNYYTCNDFAYSATFGEFNFTPQIYSHNGIQSFLLNSPTESITISAPFDITGNFAYQWYKNKMPIEGATDTILHLNGAQSEDVGDYTLHVEDLDCIVYVPNLTYQSENLVYISDPISVRRTDLEGCTDEYSCNYNQFAMIDDGSCEYLSCDTITNPIKIRTTNETVLSDTQISFDLVIDSLGLDYSADGLNFTIDTKRNYNIESIEVINPVLSIVEVDVRQLYNNTIAIDRINEEKLSSNAPILRVIACIIIDDIPTDESTCSHLAIYGGTELASGHFIEFDNIYVDIPFSTCSPYNGYGADGENWLPLVLTVSPQNCNTQTGGIAEIKVLKEGQGPFSYILNDENGAIVLEETGNTNNLIELNNLEAGNYSLTVTDQEGKQTTLHTCVPLIANKNKNEDCYTNCADYLIVPNGRTTGNIYTAKKEIEIKGFVGKDQTVEFGICD